MATTTASDLIVPDVWGDAIQPVILGKAVMAQVTNNDDSLAGQPGDHIDTPFWDYIGDADDLTEGVAMTSVAMSMTQDRALIKEVGKQVDITDTAILNAMGAPSSQAVTQLGTALARKLDADILAAAIATHTNAGPTDPFKTTAPLAFDGSAAVFSWDTFVDGTAMMGDAYAPEDMAAILINTFQRKAIMKDTMFTDVSKFGPQAVTLRGQIGSLGGVPVLITDRLPVVAGTPDTYKGLLVAKDALNLYYKRRPLVEKDRDISARVNIVTATAHYAAKRVNDRGIVVITTK